MTGIVVCILFIKKKLVGCLVILDNLRVYNFRPTSHMLLTVGGPNPVVVYKANIVQSLNCNVIDMPWGKRPPGEKGFLLGPGNKQQIGAWIIFGCKWEI